MNLNGETTNFLDALNHPLRNEIEALRQAILSVDGSIGENIKWNGPNYFFNQEDRITMKIRPPHQLQLIFHRGAKVKKQPPDKLIKDESGLLTWKENDRAIAAFKGMADIENRKPALTKIVKDWIAAAS